MQAAGRGVEDRVVVGARLSPATMISFPSILVDECHHHGRPGSLGAHDRPITIRVTDSSFEAHASQDRPFSSRPDQPIVRSTAGRGFFGYHARGPVAQRQSRRLLISRSWVQVPPGSPVHTRTSRAALDQIGRSCWFPRAQEARTWKKTARGAARIRRRRRLEPSGSRPDRRSDSILKGALPDRQGGARALESDPNADLDRQSGHPGK